MRTITIKGLGKVSVKPDLIVISMRIETEGKDYAKIMELSAEKIEMLNKAFEKVGFEKNAVKTTNFNVRTNYDSVKTLTGNYKSVFLGYTCTHSLNVEFDFDTKRLAEVLTVLSMCNVNPNFSISFTVKDPTEISAQLLKSATDNAKEKAQILCDASGEKLGKLQSIDYNWGEINVYSNTSYSAGAYKMETKAKLANIDIVPEDIRVKDTATFVWEIV